MKKRDTIADIEQRIENMFQAIQEIGGFGSEQYSPRFMAIYCTLISYADEHAGTRLLQCMMDAGLTTAGLGLLAAVEGKPQLRTVKAMFRQWQFGTDPARQADMRLLLQGIIPEQGIAFTHTDGRIQRLTRGTFLRETGA